MPQLRRTTPRLFRAKDHLPAQGLQKHINQSKRSKVSKTRFSMFLITSKSSIPSSAVTCLFKFTVSNFLQSLNKTTAASNFHMRLHSTARGPMWYQKSQLVASRCHTLQLSSKHYLSCLLWAKMQENYQCSEKLICAVHLLFGSLI